MEEQIAPSIQVPENLLTAPASASNFPTSITPEMVNMMKARAREEAIRITMEQRQAIPVPQLQVPANSQPVPQVVYVRRNLTVAELILTVFLACGIVVGVQASWNFSSNLLPRIEIKVK
jgi:hypothetical protein